MRDVRSACHSFQRSRSVEIAARQPCRARASRQRPERPAQGCHEQCSPIAYARGSLEAPCLACGSLHSSHDPVSFRVSGLRLEPASSSSLPAGSVSWYREAMAKAARDATKPRKPRPLGTGEPVMVRLQPYLAVPLDDWRRQQVDLPSRAEAIRRLVERGLRRGKVQG